jgi:hypothetical protein
LGTTCITCGLYVLQLIVAPGADVVACALMLTACMNLLVTFRMLVKMVNYLQYVGSALAFQNRFQAPSSWADAAVG